MNQVKHVYLAAAAICRPPTPEGAFRQGNVLNDLREVQVDLQQQVLAPLAHRTERQIRCALCTEDLR